MIYTGLSKQLGTNATICSTRRYIYIYICCCCLRWRTIWASCEKSKDFGMSLRTCTISKCKGIQFHVRRPDQTPKRYVLDFLDFGAKDNLRIVYYGRHARRALQSNKISLLFV